MCKEVPNVKCSCTKEEAESIVYMIQIYIYYTARTHTHTTHIQIFFYKSFTTAANRSTLSFTTICLQLGITLYVKRFEL